MAVLLRGLKHLGVSVRTSTIHRPASVIQRGGIFFFDAEL